MTQSQPHSETDSAGPHIALEGATAALMELRSSLARLLEELAGIRRAADLERALGLDRPLAWRIFRTATATDPAQVLAHLPTANQLLRVVEIARGRSVSALTLSAIIDAHHRADAAISASAESRQAFAALLSGQSRESLAPIEHRVRRDAFRSNTHLWGVHCRTLAFAAIFRFGARPDAMDAIAARAWIDLYASRAQTNTMLLSRFRATHENEVVPEGGTRVGPMEVVPGYGTQNNLNVTRTDLPDGFQETRIKLPGIGRQSRVSLFMRMHVDAANVADARAGIAHTVCHPAEAIVFDLIVPAGWSDPTTATSAAFARPHEVHRASERHPEDRIPIYDEPSLIANVQGVPPLPDIPRWPDVIQAVLAERSWQGERFDVYRLRVAYPILHTNILLDVQPRIRPATST